MYSLRILRQVIALALVSFAVPANSQPVHDEVHSQSKHSDAAHTQSKHNDSALSKNQPTRSNIKGDPWRKIKLSPQNRNALYKASGLMRLERYDDATKILTAAIQRDPKEFHLHALRAEVYSITQQYQKALADYDTVVRVQAPNSVAYAYRGKIYEKLGDDKKAVSDYSKTISLGGHFHDMRARVYMRHGQWQEALDDWTAAIKDADAENVMSMYTDRARCYDKIGKPTLADKDRIKANELLNDLIGSNVDSYPDVVPTDKTK
jgi:tetratricopeptide (TPR) repeat protein